MQIGTLKSLGYSNAVIMRQYMVYAVLAAASGSLIGAFIGMFLFPFIIMFAYSVMYIISNFYYELSPFNIVISAGSMVAAIALTVFFSARNALRRSLCGRGLRRRERGYCSKKSDSYGTGCRFSGRFPGVICSATNGECS